LERQDLEKHDVSPWDNLVGWRMNEAFTRQFNFTDRENKLTVDITYPFNLSTSYIAKVQNKEYSVQGRIINNNDLVVQIDGTSHKATVVVHNNLMHIYTGESEYVLALPVNQFKKSTNEKGSLTAPMPGKVVQVFVKTDQEVKKGQSLLILEAMKMEHLIRAPADGKIEQVYYTVGDLVEEKALLLKISSSSK